MRFVLKRYQQSGEHTWLYAGNLKLHLVFGANGAIKAFNNQWASVLSVLNLWV